MATLTKKHTYKNGGASYGIPGVRASAYIGPKMFNGPAPESIELDATNLTTPDADAETKAAAKAEAATKREETKAAKAAERQKAKDAKTADREAKRVQRETEKTQRAADRQAKKEAAAAEKAAKATKPAEAAPAASPA